MPNIFEFFKSEITLLFIETTKILIHTEDNFSLKELNDTFQVILRLMLLKFSTKFLNHFIAFDIIFSRRFLLFDVLSRLALSTFVLMSFRHYLPFDIFSFRRFLPFNIFPVDLLSHSTFCPSTFFFTIGVFYFDILSVYRKYLYTYYIQYVLTYLHMIRSPIQKLIPNYGSGSCQNCSCSF